MSNKKGNAGRKPKELPAIYRYDIRLNEVDSNKFETLFELSGYKYRGHLIRDKILNTSSKTRIVDKSMTDYIITLSQIRGQMKRIGNNYNQVLRLLKNQLGEKKALVFLYKLEKATLELIQSYQMINKQIEDLEEKWLQK